ncbi:MAG: hypothetical protein DMF06_15215 [Verrucomicrobia bacterium]|nr:MAG: hypothetical protein DMF06_15215 [Verrucomicrobiota bacterium]
MMPEWFQRLTLRERRLALIVGGGLFLLINLLIWAKLFSTLGNARAELALRKTAREEQRVYMNQRDLWAARDQWLKDHQPVLKSAGEASTLLDQVKEVGGKLNVLIENPAIGAGDSTPERQTVFASFETKSAWAPLVQFLFDLQQPEAFIVFESVQIHVDTADPTMMRGKFKMARLFAPASN